MNERNFVSHQKLLASEEQKTIFVSRKQPRFSTASFAITSITLGLIIATLVSFLPPQFSGAFLVGGVIAILVGVVVIQKPELGAYFLILAVFTNASDYMTVRGFPSINQPLIALTYVSIFANYIIRRGNLAEFPRISRVEWFLLAYYLVILISLFIASNSPNPFKIIIDVTKDILSGVCLYLAFNTKKKWQTGAWVLIIVVSNIALLGVVKMLTGVSYTFGGLAQLSELGQVLDGTSSLRYGGPIGEPNIWGQILVATLPLVLYRLVREKNAFVKINLLLALLFIILAIVYTGSRGAFVALIATLTFIAIERKVRVPTILFGMVGLIFLLMLLPSAYKDRFASLTILFDTKNEYNLAQDSSFAGRQNAMLTGLAMFRDNPFLGVGFGNYGISYWKYINVLGLDSFVGTIDPDDLPKPHSLYVEVISETGLLGIMAFAAFFGSLLTGILRIRKRNIQSKTDPEWTDWLTAFFFSILSFLISGLFLHGILWRYIWMLIGLAMAAIAISENRSIAPNLSK